MCSSLIQYTPSISGAAQGLQKPGKHEADEEPRISPFPTTKSVAIILRILQANKTMKRRVNQALASWNCARKHWGGHKLFQYLVHDCPSSRHSCSMKAFVSWIAEQIEKAKERLQRRGERNGVIRFGCWRKFEDVSHLPFDGNAINLFETLAKATKNVTAVLSEKLLRLFEQKVALDLYYTCFG